MLEKFPTLPSELNNHRGKTKSQLKRAINKLPQEFQDKISEFLLRSGFDLKKLISYMELGNFKEFLTAEKKLRHVRIVSALLKKAAKLTPGLCKVQIVYLSEIREKTGYNSLFNSVSFQELSRAARAIESKTLEIICIWDDEVGGYGSGMSAGVSMCLKGWGLNSN